MPLPLTILVPRGAEEQAVRRAAPGATIVAIAAGAASGELPAGVAPPAFVVLVGLCGSLTAARVGDVVVYTRVVGAGEPIDIAPEDVAAVEQALPQARAVWGWTSERVVTRARERADLVARSGAGARRHGRPARRAHPARARRSLCDGARRERRPACRSAADRGRARSERRDPAARARRRVRARPRSPRCASCATFRPRYASSVRSARRWRR